MPEQINPFSTRFVRPGAIEYLFSDGQSAAGLIERLRTNNWQGQIVGPHGSGKSTLLAALVEPLERAGRRVWRIDLHDGQSTLPPGFITDAHVAGADFIFVDGYEQLGRVSRLRLQWQLWRRGWGAIVTAHRDVGYPTLYRTNTSVELATRIVAQLLPADDASIDPRAIAANFSASDGDVRETLFALYDHFERAPNAFSKGKSVAASSAPARHER